MKNNILQIKADIYGRVQGVFFRASTKDTADRLGVTGWVKNMADGSVQALFQARADIMDKMLEWCNKGPANARVDKVVTQKIQDPSDFTDFKIIY
jgi:acylphosphatase